MQHKEPLWVPSEMRKFRSALTEFARFAEGKVQGSFPDYPSLHRWSVTDIEEFWSTAAEFLEVKWVKAPQRALVSPGAGKMLGGQWFPKGTLSYAANMLTDLSDQSVKIISIIEGLDQPVEWTGADLYRAVARCAAQLSRAGVKSGDRVAGVLPNTAEAIVAMLASNAVGAVWSSCSPDFGQEGILDRFGQIEPKILFMTASYIYNGKVIDCRPTIAAVQAKLPSVVQCVAVDPLGSGLIAENTVSWAEFLLGGKGGRSELRTRRDRLRPPALYSLFLRDHRQAQVHNPLGWG